MIHDPAKRAEAAVPRWTSGMPKPDQLAQAGGGRDLGGGLWERVTGPHLRAVRSQCARSKTGIVGISRCRFRKGRKKPLREYYIAQVGPRSVSFCIDTLGHDEAFRRAVRARAEHEMKVRRANAAILAARQRSENAASGVQTPAAPSNPAYPSAKPREDQIHIATK